MAVPNFSQVWSKSHIPTIPGETLLFEGGDLSQTDVHRAGGRTGERPTRYQ